VEAVSSTPQAGPWCRYSVKLVREHEERPANLLKPVTPATAAAYLHQIVAEYEREVCGALFLDAGKRAIGYTVPFMGCLTRAATEPRAFLQRALLANAAAMILFHNHPSGATFPSPEDIQFTVRMILAGGFVGVAVIDHLILGERPSYTSVIRHADLNTDLSTLFGKDGSMAAMPTLGRKSDRRRRVKPKYRHPVTGATWSGRGNMAKWLTEAIEAGAALEECQRRPKSAAFRLRPRAFVPGAPQAVSCRYFWAT
jgi:DNA repair protein RadC